MAFRSDDQDYRWPRPGHHPQQRHEPAHPDAGAALSLQDTVRELAVTILGFIGIIVLIIAAVSVLAA